MANVLNLVLENHVGGIPIAHQENIVVIVVKALLANVLDPVLENRAVNMIPTADLVNIVVVLV